MSGLKKKRDP